MKAMRGATRTLLSRQQQILDLEHYLDVLEKKPGALAGSEAAGAVAPAGRWPDNLTACGPS